VPTSRGATSVSLGLVAGAVSLAAMVFVLLGFVGSAGASAAQRPCSSYPTPGALAPAGTKVPAGLAAKYSVFGHRQRRADRLAPGQVDSLEGSGLIMSGTRFLGDGGSGERVYLVPAEHLLGYVLAPLRCIPEPDRSLESELKPQLEKQYRHAALCIEVLHAIRDPTHCAATSGTPDALLSTNGTSAFGLVPNGVSAVTVTYRSAPPRTVTVHHNFYVVVGPPQTAVPCGLQWLDRTGNVDKLVYGCSYLTAEESELSKYRDYVEDKLVALRSQLRALATAIASGNLGQAESAWLTAHLTWLSIGQDDGAYGCFGTLGGEIDGLAAGHPEGTADPAFTGFHRIEFDLWTEQDLSAAATDTAALQGLLAQLMQVPLSTYLPGNANSIANWVLRPHEVLEDALRDSLSADDDYGSGSDLASLTADVAALQELLSNLDPVLDPLAPRLAPIASGQLDALIGAIDATRAGGAWVSVQDLPARQRQQIDADLGAALETLAPVPDLLTSTGKGAPTT
jgi:hypothetical protein